MSPSSRQKWLEDVSWDFVEYQNSELCAAKSALHRPTSEGYDPTKALWESLYLTEMTLPEVVDLCRQCHRLAPFCNYNGNTFAAIVRALISGIDRPAIEVAVGRSLAGHIVAGVADSEEIAAFEKWCSADA